MTDSNANPGRTHFPIEQATIRTVALVVLVPAFVSFGFWFGTELATIRNDLQALKAGAFHRSDMAEWTRQAERENLAIGLRLPDPYELPSSAARMRSSRATGTLQGAR